MQPWNQDGASRLTLHMADGIRLHVLLQHEGRSGVSPGGAGSLAHGNFQTDILDVVLP